MKKLTLLLLCAALLLAACAESTPPAPMVQPFSFYYRTVQTDFAAEDGVIRAELRDLGTKTYSDLELFQLYLEGPRSEALISPISQDTELVSVRRSGGTLELQLTRNANSPAEFDHAVSYACLTKTGLGLDGVHKVRILVTTRGGAVEDDVLLSAGDLLLFDSGTAPDTQTLTLYYADEAGQFLLTEKRTIPLTPQAQLPQTAMELLLSPPESAGMRSPLPPGTATLLVSLESGICTVDFNGDFYANRPTGEQEELLAVLSVVNTLCELDGVNQVRLSVEGQSLDPYVRLDLSMPWLLDSAPVGPVREELGEFAGTLALPGQRDGLLHRMTVRARARGGASQAEALLLALFARTPQNGLGSPLAGAPAPLSVSTQEGVCTVELAPGTLPTEEGPRQLAIRAVTATLTGLPEIEAVTLIENGKAISLAPLVPAEDWFRSPDAAELR